MRFGDLTMLCLIYHGNSIPVPPAADKEPGSESSVQSNRTGLLIPEHS